MKSSKYKKKSLQREFRLYWFEIGNAIYHLKWLGMIKSSLILHGYPAFQWPESLASII